MQTFFEKSIADSKISCIFEASKQLKTSIMNIKEIYSIALSLYNSRITNQEVFYVNNGQVENQLKSPDICKCRFYDKSQICTCGVDAKKRQDESADWKIVAVDINNFAGMATHHVKIMQKKLGFTFIIHKDDPEDLSRIQYVYDVTVACNGDQLLLPLAKKVKPIYEKINRKFFSKLSREEWNNFDIHDKDCVIEIIKKLTK